MHKAPIVDRNIAGVKDNTQSKPTLPTPGREGVSKVSGHLHIFRRTFTFMKGVFKNGWYAGMT